MSKNSSMSERVEQAIGLTVGDLLEEIATTLQARGIADAPSEARDLLAAVYDEPRFWPVVNRAVAVDDTLLARARLAIRKRQMGAPFAYAVGRACFRHLTLAVDERVLIPRQETEQLVDLVLHEMGDRSGGVAIDVGTGSGAIALALASEGAFSAVYATDVSLDALAVARQNVEATRHTLRAPVHLMHGSLLRPVRQLRARVIVSNPPYIAFGEATSLPPSVRDWEPPVALFSGGDGMAATTALVRAAADVLEDGGLLAIEVDARRASLVAELAAHEARFDAVWVRLDLTGRERFVLARRKERTGDDRG
jgi:release factor glutamine methyltransferase